MKKVVGVISCPPGFIIGPISIKIGQKVHLYKFSNLPRGFFDFPIFQHLLAKIAFFAVSAIVALLIDLESSTRRQIVAR